MPGGIEVATAYVSVVTDTSGLARQLKGTLPAAGTSAGAATGTSFISSFKAAGIAAATVAAAAIVAAVSKGIRAGLDYNAMIESNTQALETMLGSSGAADAMMSQLQDFAAKTPFETEQLMDSTKKMLAYGFAAEDILPMLTSVGDASAAMGDPAAIDSITRALGQMQAKGKVSAEEMLQLTEQGVPAWQYLADALGTDVAGAMEMVTKRMVDADDGIAAITDGIDNNFGGMMEKQSTTWKGLWSTIGDTGKQTLGELTKPLFEFIKTLLPGIINFLEDIPGKFSGVSNTFRPISDALKELYIAVMPTVKEWWDAYFKPTFESIKEGIGALIDFIVPVIAAIIDVFRRNWPQIKAIVEPVMTTVSTVIRVAMDLIKGILRTATAIIKGDWSGAWESVKATFVNVWNTIANSPFATALERALSGVKSVIYRLFVMPINDIIRAWNSLPGVGDIAYIRMSISGETGSYGSGRSSGSQLLQFEDGGIAVGPKSGYPVMLHGTEAVIPESKWGGMGDTYNNRVTVYATVASDMDIDRVAVQLQQRLEREQRRRG